MARLLQLSDLHIVASGRLASGVLDTRELLRAAVDRLVERQAALGPFDAILVTGDVSDDGSPDSYALARAELDRFGLPLLVIPGNHDNREAFRSAFADLPVMPETGLIDWAADIGETRVIGLDTLIDGSGGGALRAETIIFLQTELREAGARPIVVALHHPPLRTGIRFMDAIGLEDVTALKRILEGAPGVALVVAGHVHSVHLGRLGRHFLATAPSLCSAFALDRRADAPVGFMAHPTGCAVIDTSHDLMWSEVPLDPAQGPYPFE
jgi:Icc protein